MTIRAIQMHPNSQAMIDAWQRMTASPEDLTGGPTVEDYPGLLECLFILQGGTSGSLPFRVAGDDLSELLGRNLIGSNFLDLWSGDDRHLLSALVEKVVSERRPGLLRGRGAIGVRNSVGVEVVLAPLNKSSVGRERILALYQILGGYDEIKDQTIGEHTLTALFPPEPAEHRPKLTLVSCND